MKIIITPYDVTKQIEFDDIESYWENPNMSRLEMTRKKDIIVYNLEKVEYFTVTK